MKLILTFLVMAISAFYLTKALECVTDDECTDKKLCAKGFCVEGCRKNEDCSSDLNKPICNLNFKVEGTSDIGMCDAECRKNEDCNTGSLTSYPFCRIATGKPNKCVDCKTNADCTNQQAPVCNSDGLCAPCTISKECSTNPTGRVCRDTGISAEDTLACGCNTDADCDKTQSGSVCNVYTRTCVCVTNQDCKVRGFGFCSVVAKTDLGEDYLTCGACESDADCKQTSGKASCLVIDLSFSKKCVFADCEESPFGSNNIGGICGCREDEDCEKTIGTPACNCATSKCVACTKDKHCKSFERCNDSKRCVALKCKQDFECFRNDLFFGGRTSSEEARCSDTGVCVSTPPICITKPQEVSAKQGSSLLNFSPNQPK